MRRDRFIVLSVVLDALLVNLGIVAAFFIRFSGELPAFNFNAYLVLAPVLTVVYLASGYVYGLYEPERTESLWTLLRAAAPAVTLGTVLTAAISFFGGPRFFAFSRLAILLSWFINVILIVGWRLVFMRVSSIRWSEQRVLIVGGGRLAHELASELQTRSRWGFHVVGTLASQDAKGFAAEGAGHCEGLPVLGTLDDIAPTVATHAVDRVIIASPVELRDFIERLTVADEIDVRIDVVPELYEVFIGRLDSVVADIPLMEITRRRVPGWYRVAKRGVDVGVAAFLLVVCAPLLLLSAFGIVVTMGLPIFYVQERSGRDMRPFRLVKFRTMVRDAERDSGPVLAVEDDPRIAGIGRFLRRYRIDELPQLFNILAGQ
ncbi:MAG: sugar transferase, partial [Coriobacteriia bacterium]|nr:sugar transferase [Coriobacteriia bacterium]